MKAILTISILVFITIITSGCNTKPELNPEQIEAQRVMAEEQHAAAKQKREEMKKEQEQKRKAAEERQMYIKETKRSFLTLSFDRIQTDGEVVLILKNVSGKDIKGVQGSYGMQDTSGVYIWGSGLTIDPAIGDLFIADNESKEVRPYGLKNKADVVTRLKNDAESVVCYFEAGSITYMDDSIEEKLVNLQ